VVFSEKKWPTYFPAPTASDHKYTRGLCVIRGGEVLTGAARLAARAARRIGAGLVTLAVPERAFPIYATSELGCLVSPIQSLHEWEALVFNERVRSILVGSGNAPDGITRQCVMVALKTLKPLVLDGGALRAFEGSPTELFKNLHSNCVLTPHAGEFEGLFPKLKGATAAAELGGCIVVLKGARTEVADFSGRSFVQEISSPWLSTGGTGDVLAGMIMGLMTRTSDPFLAAFGAVWAHGVVAQELGPCLLPEDFDQGLHTLLKTLYKV
jgi:hydroxyethylthiazole kinase-like uncharacterized protein yjeF